MREKEILEEVADILWAANEELFKDHDHAEMASILSKAVKDALDKIEDEWMGG